MLEIKFSYDILMSALNGLSLVIDDIMNDNNMRNVIFKTYGGGVSAIGANPRITHTVNFSEDTFELETDNGAEQIFLIKNKELKNFLGAFKTLVRTRVESVVFTKLNGGACERIKVTVNESEITSNGGSEKKLHKSDWVFVSEPLTVGVSEKIQTSETIEYEDFDIEMLKKYFTAYLPVLAAEGGYMSDLIFQGDTAGAKNAAFVAVIKNELDGVFKDMVLNSKSITLLNCLLGKEDTAQVGVTDSSVYFRGGGWVCSFVKEKDMQDFSIHWNGACDKNYVILDRVYLRDVLRRAMLVSGDMTVTVSDKGFQIENQYFNQILPCEKNDWCLGELKFLIQPKMFCQMILGDDGDFGDMMHICVLMQENTRTGAKRPLLILTNEDRNWRALVSVRGL